MVDASNESNTRIEVLNGKILDLEMLGGCLDRAEYITDICRGQYSKVPHTHIMDIVNNGCGIGA